jgi:hypothetical protein
MAGRDRLFATVFCFPIVDYYSPTSTEGEVGGCRHAVEGICARWHRSAPNDFAILSSDKAGGRQKQRTNKRSRLDLHFVSNQSLAEMAIFWFFDFVSKNRRMPGFVTARSTKQTNLTIDKDLSCHDPAKIPGTINNAAQQLDYSNSTKLVDS